MIEIISTVLCGACWAVAIVVLACLWVILLPLFKYCPRDDE